MSARKPLSFINARITSLISVTLVLFLLGIIIMMTTAARQLSTYVRENITFSIILNSKTTEAQANQLKARIQRGKYAKEVTFISQEQALKELTEELGEDPSAFVGFNPLLPSLEIKMKAEYANPDSIAKIEKRLRKESSIHEVLYRKDMLQIVNDNIKRVSFVLLFVVGLLMFISYALISNTIRLTVYSKRFLIYTMKLVGATDQFIRWPFIREYIVAGIFSGIVACSILYSIIAYLSTELSALTFLFNWELVLLTSVSVITLGALFALFAAMLSTNRFLRMKQEELFTA